MQIEASPYCMKLELLPQIKIRTRPLSYVTQVENPALNCVEIQESRQPSGVYYLRNELPSGEGCIMSLHLVHNS